MKLVTILLLVFALARADECPAKLMKLATKNVKSYLGGIYKDVKNLKLNCSYSHDANIFNLEHHVVASTKYKDKKVSFEVKTHSSMFDLYNFTDFDGFICHSKMDNLKDSKDRGLIRKSFFKKYANDVTSKDIKKFARKGQVCYKAVIGAKKKMKRSLL